MLENQKNIELKLVLDKDEYKRLNGIISTYSTPFKQMSVTEVDAKKPLDKETPFIILNCNYKDFEREGDYVLVYEKKHDKYFLSDYTLFDYPALDEELVSAYYEGHRSRTLRRMFLLSSKASEEYIETALMNFMDLYVPSNLSDYNLLFVKIFLRGKVFENEDRVVYNVRFESYKDNDIHIAFNRCINLLSPEKQLKIIYPQYLAKKNIGHRYSGNLLHLNINKNLRDKLVEDFQNYLDRLDAVDLIPVFIKNFILPTSWISFGNTFMYLRDYFMNYIIDRFTNEDVDAIKTVIEIDNGNLWAISIDRYNTNDLMERIECLSKLLYHINYFSTSLYMDIKYVIESARERMEYALEKNDKITVSKLNTVYDSYMRSLFCGIWNISLNTNQYRSIGKQVNYHNRRIQKLFLHNIHCGNYFDMLTNSEKELMYSLIKFHLLCLNSRSIASIINTHHENLSIFAYKYLEERFIDEFVIPEKDTKKRTYLLRAICDGESFHSSYEKFEDYEGVKGTYYLSTISYLNTDINEITKKYSGNAEIEKELKRYIMRKALQDKK